LRHFTLPLMVVLLGVYIALHSPLRDVLAARFGMVARGCYFCFDAAALARALDALAALVALAAALLAAWRVTDRFEGTAYERPLVFGLTGLGLLVVPAAALGGLSSGMRIPLLRPPLGPLLTALPALVVVAANIRAGWRPSRPHVTWTRPGKLVLWVGGLAGVLLLASAAASLIHPPTGGDAVSYHAPLAVFLWQGGDLTGFLDRAPQLWALAHPGAAELWFGLLLIIGGEALANLGQLPFALLGSAAIVAFARRLGLGAGAALLAACAFLLVPMVVMQIGMQPNDVIGAALLMTTMALASAPLRDWTSGRLALLGLGLGLVAATKLALLPCVAAISLFIAGAVLWQGRRQADVRKAAVGLSLVALMFLVAVGPWWLRNIGRYGNPIYPAALPLIGYGVFIPDLGRIDTAFIPSARFWPLYPLLEAHDDRSGFGALVIVGLVPGLLWAVLRSRRRQPVALYLLTVIVMLPAWWVFTLHEPRFLLGLIGLGFAFLPWALLALPSPQRRLGALVIAAAALFSALVTLDQAILPFIRQPVARTEFYDRVWAVDPVVTSLSEQDALLHHTGYAPTIFEYAAYYALLGPSRTRLVLPVDGQLSTETIIATMRRAGARYAYVAASPQSHSEVEALYDSTRFDLVHISTVTAGERNGARRHLYRPATPGEEAQGTRRYLYRLK
jgi:hypothetical protein